jgi:undecaprenyl-diphosphatase
MSWLEAVVLGVVQGITEFLPISSTAHLKIVPALLGWGDPGAAFSAVIQLGTVGAVLSYFAADVKALGRALAADVRALVGAAPEVWRGRPRRPADSEGRTSVWADLVAAARRRHRAEQGPGPFSTVDSRLAWYVGLGTVPIVVGGLLFKSAIHSTLRSLWVIAGSLIVLAVVLAWVERRATHARALEQLTLRDALIIGTWQALALIPGSSRSGTTLTGGLSLGLNREAAARYSFLLSIPATALAGLFELKGLLQAADRPSLWLMLIGTVVSFGAGLAAIAGLLRFLRTRSTLVFVAYRIVLGAVLIGLLASGRLAP